MDIAQRIGLKWRPGDSQDAFVKEATTHVFTDIQFQLYACEVLRPIVKLRRISMSKCILVLTAYQQGMLRFYRFVAEPMETYEYLRLVLKAILHYPKQLTDLLPLLSNDYEILSVQEWVSRMTHDQLLLIEKYGRNRHFVTQLSDQYLLKFMEDEHLL